MTDLKERLIGFFKIYLDGILADIDGMVDDIILIVNEMETKENRVCPIRKKI